MAQITLRSYVEYIEDRLQRDAHPEVVAQCRHVLQDYPKYVEIYKLLARSLLDQENYQDALDLFQRVLSADPNDFLAHVGISECYHENGALDQAIWHLERAFEQVPNNTEIQDEIRRLYAERDGQAPRRLYLTGGALARLYLRGRLHQQAIAELRKALDRDPERTDLRVLLAQGLWEYQATAEAGQVAAEVLRQLPNSMDANRILALLWLRAGEPDEARPFLERLRALDPYTAHRAEHGGAALPADAFRLELLEYTADRHAAEIGAADWVSQLDGIGTQAAQPARVEPAEPAVEDAAADLRSAFEEDTPDWLSAIEGAEGADESGAALDAEMPTLDDLASAYEPAAGEEELAPAADEAGDLDETPDWLFEILASEEDDEPEPADEMTEPEDSTEVPTETPDWLADILGPEDAAEPEPETAFEQPAEATVEAAAAEPEREPEPEPVDEQPDWLSEILDEEDAVDAVDAPEGEQQPVEWDEPPAEEPDWLSEILADEESEGQAEPEPAPSEAAVEADSPDADEVFEGVEDAPDWLSEILGEEAGEPEPDAAPEAAAEVAAVESESSETPDWLDEVLAEDDSPELEDEAEETADVAVVEAEDGETPDWLDEVLAEDDAAEASFGEAEELAADDVTAAEADAGSEAAPEETIAEQPAPAYDEEPAPAGASDEPPAWLSAIPGEPPIPLFGDDEAFTSQPDWLNDVWGEPVARERAGDSQPEPAGATGGEPDGEDIASSVEPPAEEDAPPAPAAIEEDEAAAPEWLEDLAAEESEAPTPVLEDDDLAPDWLRQELLGEQEEAGEGPDWLDSEPPPPAAEEAAADVNETEAAGDMPGWLRETLAEEQPAVAEIAPAEPAPDAAEPVGEADSEPEMPDWLHDAIHGQQPAVAEVPEPEEPAEPDNVVSEDWLDEIIGGPELGEIALEDLDDAADEWLAEMGQGYTGDPFDDLETWDDAVERLEQEPPAPPPAPVEPSPQWVAEDDGPPPPAPPVEPEPEADAKPEAQPRSGLLSRLGKKGLGTDKLKAAPPPPATDLPDWLHDPSLAAPQDAPGEEADDDTLDGAR